MRWRPALALLPAALGIFLYLLLQASLRRIPILSIDIDFGLVSFFCGILLSAFLLPMAILFRNSARKRQSALEKERRSQVESRRRFLRRLDHELKNPLTGIRAALVNLEDSPGAGSASFTMMDIQRQVLRLTRLTADLRKLADLEEIPLERERMNVGEILKEAAETVQAHPAGAGREIRLVIPSVPWPLPEISGDHDLLHLAFCNLIDNALKFSGKQDTVEIRASEQGHFIQVDIADTGPGIPAEDLPRVFEELYRGSNAQGFEGSGLGLALVHRIILRHQGSITVRSRREGRQGTVFTVSLPMQTGGPNVHTA